MRAIIDFNFFVVFVSIVNISQSLFVMSKPMMQQHINRPGGYAPISNMQDKRVQTAAQFAVQTLRSDQQEQPIPSDHYSFQKQLRDDISDNNNSLMVTVVRGNQQVVAGMNYKLTIVVTTTSSATAHGDSGNDIVGAFEVTVYDNFGNLSVTQWGPEVSQNEAKSLLLNYQTHW
jgi:Cystatin domain